MLRRTLFTLSASALLSAAIGATDGLAFPFGPPPGPPPGLAGLPHGFGGPPPGLAGFPRGLAGPAGGLARAPHVGLGGSPARAGLGGPPRLGTSAARSVDLSRLGGGSVHAGRGQVARYGSGYGHGGSRYGRWARDGLYGYAAGASGYATSGYGYGSDGYAYSGSGCAYVYGYGGAYRRTAACSDD